MPAPVLRVGVTVAIVIEYGKYVGNAFPPL
jgi:hypothetical protein